MARAGPVQSRSLVLSPKHHRTWQTTEWEMEQVGLKPTLLRDTGIAGGGVTLGTFLSVINAATILPAAAIPDHL